MKERPGHERNGQAASNESPPKVPGRLERRGWPARFYQAVAVGGAENGFHVLLDGRAVKTPGKNAFLLSTRSLADAVAAEWGGQDKVIDPTTMPLTRLANTAIDGVAPNKDAVAADIVKYAGTDMLFYRAGAPQGLVRKQSAAWDPIVGTISAIIGERFAVSASITHAPQSRRPWRAFSALSAHMMRSG